jgi:peptidoglycan/xylan/chitin deacetylase (PgdA/CDA1 family)
MRNSSKKFLARFCYGLRNLLDPFLNFEEVAILAYHSISDAPLDTAVTPEEFEKQLAYLSHKGFALISLDHLMAWLDKERPLPRKAVAITFDDGYADFETAALPVLTRFPAPVTLFMVGEGGSTPEIHKNLQNEMPLLSKEALERIRSHSSLTIGYHSLTHANLARITGESLENEITPRLSAAYFAYPGGNYSTEALGAVKNAGYKAAFSIKRHLLKRHVHVHSSSRYVLPRSVVTRNMQPWEVGMHVTQALEWYRWIGGLFKDPHMHR